MTPTPLSEVAESVILRLTTLHRDLHDTQQYDDAQLIAAAIDLLRAQAGGEREAWRPIESAPKNGTRVLVYWPALMQYLEISDQYFVAHMSRAYGHWQAGNYFCSDVFIRPPTHWMPLPSPPKEGV